MKYAIKKFIGEWLGQEMTNQVVETIGKSKKRHKPKTQKPTYRRSNQAARRMDAIIDMVAENKPHQMEASARTVLTFAIMAEVGIQNRDQAISQIVYEAMHRRKANGPFSNAAGFSVGRFIADFGKW